MTAQIPSELLASLLVRFEARRLHGVELIDAFFVHSDAAQLDAVLEAAHKLAGIAGTLAFAEIGLAAADVDRHAPALPLDPASRARIERLRSALVEAVRQPSPESEAQ